MMETFESFDEAFDLQTVDQTLVGVYDDDGKPIYFLAPADAPDGLISSMGFEAKHGRQPNEEEQILKGMLDSRRPKEAQL